jgi:hypothetical protein
MDTYGVHTHGFIKYKFCFQQFDSIIESYHVLKKNLINKYQIYYLTRLVQ